MSAAATAVYADYMAAAPLLPETLEAMQPYLREKFGNAHSRSHAYGWEAEAAVDLARERVAALIGAAPEEIIFTSGATEANNLALKGTALAKGFRSFPGLRIVTQRTEHKCVLESCRFLERQGARAVYLPVNREGVLQTETLAEALHGEETFLVSVMAANNETGALQDLPALSALCRAAGALFHSDIAQAAGKIPLDVRDVPLDMASLSAHKMGGPKGVGALYIRRKPRIPVEPLMSGGGQERGIRSGTLPVPLIVGFGAACETVRRSMDEERLRLENLTERFIAALREVFPDLAVNGSEKRRLPGCVNFRIPGMNAEKLLSSMRDVAMSGGAACASGAPEPSYVLRAMGLTDEEARSSLRAGFGRGSSEQDVLRAAVRVAEEARRQF